MIERQADATEEAEKAEVDGDDLHLPSLGGGDESRRPWHMAAAAAAAEYTGGVKSVAARADGPPSSYSVRPCRSPPPAPACSVHVQLVLEK
jgi:hypothetical protein